jgi:exopolysaccharide production protein ExoZ
METQLREYQSIQTLRAVAAVLVVFMHTLFHYDDNLQYLLEAGPAMSSFYQLKSWGGSGVHIFFVISGFVMMMLHERKSSTAWGFMIDRITRIVPLYWVATLAWIALQVCTGNTSYTWWQLAQSFLMLPPYERFVVLGVGWTLNYEMFFYVSFALLIIAGRLTFVWMAIYFAAIAVFAAFLPNYLLTFAADPIVWEFLAGMVIWHVHRHWVARRIAPYAFATGAALLMASVLDVGSFIAKNPALLWGVPSFLYVLGAVSMEVSGIGLWLFRSRIMLRLGAASYVLYLFHTQAIYFINGNVLYRLRLQHYLSADGLVFLLVAVICMLGLVVHRLVERPLTEYVRRIVRRPVRVRLHGIEPIAGL